jgi:hypothetical protein
MKKINLIILLFLSSLTFFGQDSLPKPKGWKINPSKSIILKSDNPLIIFNEKLVDYNLINILDSKKVESMHIIKGDSSIAKYGENGKYGAIEIKQKYFKERIKQIIQTLCL